MHGDSRLTRFDLIEEDGKLCVRNMVRRASSNPSVSLSLSPSPSSYVAHNLEKTLGQRREDFGGTATTPRPAGSARMPSLRTILETRRASEDVTRSAPLSHTARKVLRSCNATCRCARLLALSLNIDMIVETDYRVYNMDGLTDACRGLSAYLQNARTPPLEKMICRTDSFIHLSERSMSA